MNIKSIALAVGIAASTFTMSNAAPSILDPLDLEYLDDGQFSTGLDTADGFWGTFTSIFNANGFQSMLDSFRVLAADFDEFEWNNVGFNSTTMAPWSGFLNFSEPTKTVTFASSNFVNGAFVPNATVAVPGPEAGAGMGALILGGMAFWLARRRKEQVALAA